MAKHREYKSKTTRQFSTCAMNVPAYRVGSEAAMHPKPIQGRPFMSIPGPRPSMARSNSHGSGWAPKKGEKEDDRRGADKQEDSDLQNLRWLSQMNFTFPPSEEDMPTDSKAAASAQPPRPSSCQSDRGGRKQHAYNVTRGSASTEQFAIRRNYSKGNSTQSNYNNSNSNNSNNNNSISDNNSNNNSAIITPNQELWNAQANQLSSFSQQQASLNMAVGVESLSTSAPRTSLDGMHSVGTALDGVHSVGIGQLSPTDCGIDPSMTMRKGSNLLLQRTRSPSAPLVARQNKSATDFRTTPSAQTAMNYPPIVPLTTSSDQHGGMGHSHLMTNLRASVVSRGQYPGLVMQPGMVHTMNGTSLAMQLVEEAAHLQRTNKRLDAIEVIVLSLFCAPMWSLSVAELHDFVKKRFPGFTEDKCATEKGKATWKTRLRVAMLQEIGLMKLKKTADHVRTRWTFRSESHAIELLNSVHSRIIMKRLEASQGERHNFSSRPSDPAMLEFYHNNVRESRTLINPASFGAANAVNKKAPVRPSRQSSTVSGLFESVDSLLLEPLGQEFSLDLGTPYGTGEGAVGSLRMDAKIGSDSALLDQYNASTDGLLDTFGLESAGLSGDLFPDIDHMDLTCLPSSLKLNSQSMNLALPTTSPSPTNGWVGPLHSHSVGSNLNTLTLNHAIMGKNKSPLHTHTHTHNTHTQTDTHVHIDNPASISIHSNSSSTASPTNTDAATNSTSGARGFMRARDTANTVIKPGYSLTRHTSFQHNPDAVSHANMFDGDLALLDSSPLSATPGSATALQRQANSLNATELHGRNRLNTRSMSVSNGSRGLHHNTVFGSSKLDTGSLSQQYGTDVSSHAQQLSDLVMSTATELTLHENPHERTNTSTHLSSHTQTQTHALRGLSSPLSSHDTFGSTHHRPYGINELGVNDTEDRNHDNENGNSSNDDNDRYQNRRGTQSGYSGALGLHTDMLRNGVEMLREDGRSGQKGKIEREMEDVLFMMGNEGMYNPGDDESSQDAFPDTNTQAYTKTASYSQHAHLQSTQADHTYKDMRGIRLDDEDNPFGPDKGNVSCGGFRGTSPSFKSNSNGMQWGGDGVHSRHYSHGALVLDMDLDLDIQKDLDLRIQKDLDLGMQKDLDLRIQKDLDLGMHKDLDLGMHKDLDLGMQKDLDLGVQKDHDLGIQKDLDLGIQKDLDLGMQKDLDLGMQDLGMGGHDGDTGLELSDVNINVGLSGDFGAVGLSEGGLPDCDMLLGSPGTLNPRPLQSNTSTMSHYDFPQIESGVDSQDPILFDMLGLSDYDMPLL